MNPSREERPGAKKVDIIPEKSYLEIKVYSRMNLEPYIRFGHKREDPVLPIVRFGVGLRVGTGDSSGTREGTWGPKGALGVKTKNNLRFTRVPGAEGKHGVCVVCVVE